MVLIERMSQFQFKFDVTSSSQARTILASPQEEERNEESLISSNEKSCPFQLIDELSSHLKKRRQERLDYVTVDLPADSLLAPLLQVQSAVTAGVDSTCDKIDNFRMNTRSGRYGAAYNMVALLCFNEELLLLPKNPTEAKLQATSTRGESTEPT
jgi:hypothetical protein